MWRCHIGSAADSEGASPADTAWAFLEPFLARFDAFVFSNPLYIPCCVAGSGAPVLIIRPGITPASSKNQELAWHEIASVLTRAHRLSDLVMDPHNTCAPFQEPVPAVSLYRGGGVWESGAHSKHRQHPNSHAVPFLTRPVVTQVSRWDALKGWLGLIAGFAALKGGGGAAPAGGAPSEHEEALVCNAVLLLVGPDPRGVADDPEGGAHLLEVCRAVDALPHHVGKDVRLVLLPMDDAKANALMVNAIQRAS